MRTAAALLVLVLLLFLNPAVVAAAPPAARMDLAVLLWESAGAVPFAGDGRFSPDRPLTREELAVALRRYARILGRDTFLPAGAAECNDYADISPWADDSLYWAAGIGLLAWGADGRPEPQGTLSPEELEQALARFFDRPVPAIPYLLEHW